MAFFQREHKEPAWLVAGLGNPGPKYARTRHNLGFMALDHVSRDFGVPVTRAKYQGLIGQSSLAQVEGHSIQAGRAIPEKGRQGLPDLAPGKLYLLKPLTYMNESGRSIRALMKGLKIPSQRLIVLYDDFDLPLGTLRLREKGGAGTHNGMRSIVNQLGTDDFIRLRIGCGPMPPGEDIIRFVLSDLKRDELSEMDALFDELSVMLRLIFRGGATFAQNYINTLKQKN